MRPKGEQRAAKRPAGLSHVDLAELLKTFRVYPNGEFYTPDGKAKTKTPKTNKQEKNNHIICALIRLVWLKLEA